MKGEFVCEPEVYRIAVQFLGKLAKREELQREYNLIEELINLT